jgi:alpha-glucosidase
MTALMCLRGTIFLYQGEELGLPQADVPLCKLRDPFAIAAYDGGAFRDGARTPIPWTADGPSAGFSSGGETWLPVDPAHRPLAIAEQEGRADSMLAFTRRLIGLRRASEALRSGEACVTPLPEQDGLLAFERRTTGETLVCLFDLAGTDRRLEIAKGARLFFAAGDPHVSEGPGRPVLDLPAYGAAILRLNG